MTKLTDQPIVADAACDVAEAVPTTRVRRVPMSFIEARMTLHDAIDKLNGEDLAEVLAEVQGEDRARFDAPSGQVVLERDVVIPHCDTIQLCAVNGAQGVEVDWVNEDGESLTTTFPCSDAESLIKEIAQHLGLTIS